MDDYTLLDEKVSEFYKVPEIGIIQNVKKYFCVNNVFDWVQVGKLLQYVLPHNEGWRDLKYDEYIHVVQGLHQVFVPSMKVAEQISKRNCYFNWLGDNWTYLRQFSEDVEDFTATTALEQILLMTALLEFGLGNVFCSQSMTDKQPPHLLRDLLDTEALLNIFGWEAIFFLKILLGTPKSINLRNIVWHGFPQPAEVPECYCAVMLVIINTLGYELHKKNIALRQRDLVKELKFVTLTKEFYEIAITSDDLRRMSSTSKLSVGHRLYWERLSHYYGCNRWWQFVVLILPQIELILRLLYRDANGCNVCARLDHYYVTIDTIFESRIPPTNEHLNRLLTTDEYISVGGLKCVYDLFVAPHGPRIRDKISHGEVCLAAVNNKQLCHILMVLAIDLLRRKRDYLSRYESHFHVNSLSYHGINTANKSLSLLLDLQMASLDACRQENTIQDIVIDSLRIFCRPKKEAQIMPMILRLSRLISQTCNNYYESMSERMISLELRELHSKRRNTLEKTVTTLPEVWRTLHAIVHCLEIIFVGLQHDDEDTISRNDQITIKFLKHTLKIVENLVKYSSKERNEWIKALQMCTKFKECRLQFFQCDKTSSKFAP